MGNEFKLIRDIKFAETDMAGIMHFSNFFRLMEETEHAFFRSLSIPVQQEVDNHIIGWPRVTASCEYLHPLKFEDKVEIHMLVKKINGKTITYKYQFYKIDGNDKIVVAQGKITTVCVQLNMHKEEMEPISIPSQIFDKIQTAFPEILLEQD